MTKLIEQLRYVWFETPDLAGASSFASDIVGLECAWRDADTAYFRSDDRGYTLAYHRGERSQAFVGFEVRSAETLDAIEQALRVRGLAAMRGDAALCALRRVRHLLRFSDHSGNAIELVVRPDHRGRRSFPSRDAGVTSFLAVSFDSTDPEKDAALWCEVFGASISDYVGDAIFLRIDDVHHRIAFYPARKPGLSSLSFEVEDFNNIMQSWYFLGERQVRIVQGPGRQPFSGQVFVKFQGPDESVFVYTQGTNRIADAGTWRPRQFSAAPDPLCMWGTQAPDESFRLTR